MTKEEHAKVLAALEAFMVASFASSALLRSDLSCMLRDC